MLIVEGHKMLPINIGIHKNPDQFTDDELYEFCVMNRDLRIERDADSNIIIMTPIGGYSGFYDDEMAGEIRSWRKKMEENLLVLRQVLYCRMVLCVSPTAVG